MNWPKRAALTVCLTVAFAVVARADQWNDRTTLKFDAPVMVPGATLAPGTYTFKLLDSSTTRHVVQIFNEDQTKLIVTANAIPAKRQNPNSDVVVKLNPTEAGAPIALKAWFYPGSLYGHEFVYPENQARDIAQRTKTLVLSSDAPNGDMKQGTLYLYSAAKERTPWRGDAIMLEDWQKWNEEGRRAASGDVAVPGNSKSSESTAPMVRTEPIGMDIKIGDLEDDPTKYVGKTISVTAEVEEVFGPRLFKIDEPNWADLDGEVLVYLPSNLAALVRENDRVTVTGTVKTMMRADLEREVGWLEADPDFELEFASRPVIVADKIVGGNNDVALAIRISSEGDTNRVVGTSGSRVLGGNAKSEASTGSDKSVATASSEPITSTSAFANGGMGTVGRRVTLQGLMVTRQTGRGFWVKAPDASLFILPTQAGKERAKTPKITAGQTVSIEGVVLEMPQRLQDEARGIDNANDEIYVYATMLK
jgi:hypothetical protein